MSLEQSVSDKEMTAILAEIREELAISAAVQRGKADIAAGRTVSHEEVKQRSAMWNTIEKSP